MSEWERTKQRLEYLEREPELPSGGALGKTTIDHALLAKALRLIMEKLEDP